MVEAEKHHARACNDDGWYACPFHPRCCWFQIEARAKPSCQQPVLKNLKELHGTTTHLSSYTFPAKVNKKAREAISNYLNAHCSLKKTGRNDEVGKPLHPTPNVCILRRATLSSSTRDIGMTASLATSVVVEYRGSKLGITWKVNEAHALILFFA